MQFVCLTRSKTAQKSRKARTRSILERVRVCALRVPFQFIHLLTPSVQFLLKVDQMPNYDHTRYKIIRSPARLVGEKKREKKKRGGKKTNTKKKKPHTVFYLQSP